MLNPKINTLIKELEQACMEADVTLSLCVFPENEAISVSQVGEPVEIAYALQCQHEGLAQATILYSELFETE